MHLSLIIKDCFKGGDFLTYKNLKNAQNIMHLSTIFCALVRDVFHFHGVFRILIPVKLFKDGFVCEEKGAIISFLFIVVDVAFLSCYMNTDEK